MNKAYTQDLVEPYDHRHFGGKSGQHILEKDVNALQTLLPLPPALLLDVPCGTGIYSAAFTRIGYRVVASDASGPMLAITGQRDGNLARALSDVTHLPFPDSAFDATLTLRLFSHFSPTEIAPALRELGRVVKPGGRVIFDTFRWTPRRWPLVHRFVAQGYIHEIASAAVEALIRDAGLRMIATETSYLFSPILQRKLPIAALRALTAIEDFLPDGWLLRTFWACTKDT